MGLGGMGIYWAEVAGVAGLGVGGGWTGAGADYLFATNFWMRDCTWIMASSRSSGCTFAIL